MCWNFAGNLRTQQSCYSRHCGMPVTCDNEARAVLLPANSTILLLSALRNARGGCDRRDIYLRSCGKKCTGIFIFDGKIARWGAAIRFDSWPSRKNRYSLASELRNVRVIYRTCSWPWWLLVRRCAGTHADVLLTWARWRSERH